MKAASPDMEANTQRRTKILMVFAILSTVIMAGEASKLLRKPEPFEAAS